VVMITGANAGIGKETTRQLISLGATVIMACRSEEKAKEAIDDIKETTSGRMIFLEMDLSSLSSIRRAVDNFCSMNLPLHVLINNAGVMMGQHKKTIDGYEMAMQCNHLGHFLLTSLLLPKLRLHEDARVVTVSSSTYQLAKNIELDDLNCERRNYQLFGQYAQSKLANILFSLELTQRENALAQKENRSGVACHCLHPGLVRTNIVKNMPWALKVGHEAFGFVLRLLQKTPSAGAYTSVWCAASDDLKRKSGKYYVNSRETVLRGVANDEEIASKLWELSSKLVKV